MKSIEELLRNLARPEVLEFGLVTDRLPSVNVGGKFEPVDDEAPDSDKVLQMLVAVGGSRYVESLGNRPTQWTSRLEGVGVITIAAIIRKGTVQARFTVTRRDPAAVAPEPAGERRGPLPEVPASHQVDPTGVTRPMAIAPARPAPTADIQADDGADRDDEPTLQIVPTPSRFPGSTAVSSRDGANAKPPSLGAIATHAAAKVDARAEPVSAPAGPMPPRSISPTSPGARPDLEIVRNAVAQAREEDLAAAATDPTVEVLPSGGLKAVPPASAGPPTDPDGSQPDAGVEAPAPMTELERDRDPSIERAVIVTAPPMDVKTLEPLLALAVGSGASDLHVVSGRPALLRVASDLLPRTNAIAAADVDRMAAELVPKRLVATLASEGSCDFAFEHKKHGRFRVNVSRQSTGIKICMRVIAREIPTLASLGLPDAIGTATHHHQGLIVVTGPTGHGKTNTLAAIVDILNSETTGHIITIEDPVEFVHSRKKALISQREVGAHTRSFTTALNGSLREDPEVIVVGELRDAETVRAAVSASETGHLVLGTMNTPNAAKTIDRLIDLFPPGDQGQIRMTLAGGLRLIVSQRLVPSSDRTRLHAAVELLPGSIALYSLIRDNRTFQIPSLQQRGKSLGIVRLDESLVELVRAGKITAHTAKVYAEAPQEIDAQLAARAPQAAGQKQEGFFNRGIFGGRKG